MFRRRRRERRRPEVSAESVLRDRVVTGHTLLAQGRTVDAEQVLVGALPLLSAVGPTTNTFLTLRLLGQCARTTGRLDTARAYYSRALDVAEALGDPDLAAAAVSGMAFVELAADDLPRADEYFRQAVQLVRTLAPGPGRITVLRNYADLLVRVRDGRAATFYQEALEQPGVDGADRAAMLVALGRELYRRGRTAAGMERLRAGATLFAEAGVDGETYAALVTLAGLARDTDPAVAADAFAHAHALALTLQAPIDERHYTEGFAARVRQVEADTERRAAAGELPSVAPPAVLAASHGLGPDVVRTVTVGAPAMIGSRSLEEGAALTAAGRFADAEAKLRMAEVMWSALGAAHVLPRVWVAQGRLALRRGDDADARVLLDRARAQAAALGDARTELAALTGLADLIADTAQPRPIAGELPADLRLLDVLGQATALATFLTGHGEGGQSEAGRGEAGQGAAAETPDAAAAALCVRYGAFDLAEHYLRRAAARERSVVALAELATFLARRGSAGGGRDSGARASGARDGGARDGGARQGGARASGARDSGARGGGSSADEVAALRAELAAAAERSADPLVRASAGGAAGRIAAAAGEWTDETWERLRDASAAYDTLRAAGIAPRGDSPHLAAAEVGVRLGYHAEALALVRPGDAEPHPLVVFFPGACGVYALTSIDGRVSGTVVSAAPGGPSPARCAAVVDAAAAHGPVTVVAAGALYGVPVHRAADGSSRPGVVLLPPGMHRPPAPPSAGGTSAGTGTVAVAVAVDDLPFARIAAEYLGEGDLGQGDAPATVERLRAGLETASLVVVSCRVVTDARRPERSALLLTGPDGAPDRVDTTRLAALPWAGTVVVLSPGEGGGVPPVVVRTLLEAGARAVVASAVPVDGLTAAVLTTWLHDELRTRPDVDAALASVQERLRAATGDDLLTWAADRPSLCAEQLAVVTERAERKHPFAAEAPYATYGVSAPPAPWAEQGR